MECGIEPDAGGGQCGGEVCHGELVIAFVFESVGIGELVFMKVCDGRQVPDGGRRQAQELCKIKHIRAENKVPCLAGASALFELLGEGDGRVAHSPFPFVSGQSQYGPPVVTDGRPAVEEGLVTATVVGLKRQYPHRFLLYLLVYTLAGCSELQPRI